MLDLIQFGEEVAPVGYGDLEAWDVPASDLRFSIARASTDLARLEGLPADGIMVTLARASLDPTGLSDMQHADRSGAVEARSLGRRGRHARTKPPEPDARHKR